MHIWQTRECEFRIYSIIKPTLKSIINAEHRTVSGLGDSNSCRRRALKDIQSFEVSLWNRWLFFQEDEEGSDYSLNSDEMTIERLGTRCICIGVTSNCLVGSSLYFYFMTFSRMQKMSLMYIVIHMRRQIILNILETMDTAEPVPFLPESYFLFPRHWSSFSQQYIIMYIRNA